MFISDIHNLLYLQAGNACVAVMIIFFGHDKTFRTWLLLNQFMTYPSLTFKILNKNID